MLRHPLIITRSQGLLIGVVLALLIIQGAAPGVRGVFFLNALIVFICACATARQVRRSPDVRTARFWGLMSAAMGSWAAGEFIWQWQNTFSGQTLPFPSLGDIGYLLAVPFMIGALLLVARGARPLDARTYALDLTILLLGPVTAVWVWAIYPPLKAGFGGQDISVALAYPMADVLLVLLVTRALIIKGRRNAPLIAIVWGFFLFITADVVFAAMIINGWYENGNPWGSLWALGFLAMAVASLHPQAGQVLEQKERQTDTPSTAILIPIAISALAIPLSALAAWAIDLPRHVPSVTASAVLILILIMIRVMLMVRASERQTKELAHTLDELAQEREARDHLIVGTLKALESERKFVAAELHDGPVQSLAALTYMLDAAKEGADARELAQNVRTHIEQEIQSLRRIMSELRPPALDEQGLMAATQNLVADFEASTGAQVQLHLNVAERLAEAQELVVYRVVQESLMNIAKHAQASMVVIDIETDAQRMVHLRVDDDGVGFDPDKVQGTEDGHFGIAVMRERVEIAGGKWHLGTKSGHGTQISASIPVRYAQEVAP